MASISRTASGLCRILFVDANSSRKSIYLGRAEDWFAASVKRHVEHLVVAQKRGASPPAETIAWLDDIDADLRAKLAKVNLAAEPDRSRLGKFLDDYAERRCDVKPATKVIWRHVRRNLKDFFGTDRDMASIGEGDAEDFKQHLIREQLASTTVHKRLQVARMFFRDALKRKLVNANPFAGVTAIAVNPKQRQFFVTREATEHLLKAADPTWRLIIGLSRYAGLRCPSEVLSLKWEGVNWETGRIVVESPKTEHRGKASRVIPIFPSLRPILEEADELAPPGAVYVVPGDYREASLGPEGWRNCNLRTPFMRLIKRAGLTPWPRLFHSMRASCETELAREFPIHVVTDWLGNTPKIALQHYLQTTDADFERAAGDAESSAVDSLRGDAPGCAALHAEGPETPKAPENPGLLQSHAFVCSLAHTVEMAGAGFEPTTSRL